MRRDYIRYLLVFGLLNFCFGSYAQEVDGSAIFATNCAACHTIGQGQLVGPDLKGVTEKYDKPWIARFIRESQAMIEEGDEKAVAVFNAYSMIPMPAMPLSDEQIDAVLAHIKKVGEEGSKPESEPVVVEKKVIKPTKSKEQIKRELPEEDRKVVRDGLMTGFWVSLGAFTIMGLGIWWATKS